MNEQKIQNGKKAIFCVEEMDIFSTAVINITLVRLVFYSMPLNQAAVSLLKEHKLFKVGSLEFAGMLLSFVWFFSLIDQQKEA